jgi:DNA-binding transcriptional regulator/RsmH inhibitor MraZ
MDFSEIIAFADHLKQYRKNSSYLRRAQYVTQLIILNMACNQMLGYCHQAIISLSHPFYQPSKEIWHTLQWTLQEEWERYQNQLNTLSKTWNTDSDRELREKLLMYFTVFQHHWIQLSLQKQRYMSLIAIKNNLYYLEYNQYAIEENFAGKISHLQNTFKNMTFLENLMISLSLKGHEMHTISRKNIQISLIENSSALSEIYSIGARICEQFITVIQEFQKFIIKEELIKSNWLLLQLERLQTECISSFPTLLLKEGQLNHIKQ